MSDTSADQQEPSMEEILASIRRIISEDGDGGEEAVEATASEPEPGPEAAEAEDEDDVLELTDVVEPEEEPEPEPGEEPEPVAFEPEPEPEEAFEPEPGPASEPEPLAAPDEDDDRLISPETEVESTAAMAGLAAALAAQAPLGDSQKTLEALVKELMRPMLKDWLDANLPGLVERVVREEVERISKKAK